MLSNFIQADVFQNLLSFLLLYKYARLFLITFLAAFALPLPSTSSLMTTAGFASQGYLNIGWMFFLPSSAMYSLTISRTGLFATRQASYSSAASKCSPQSLSMCSWALQKPIIESFLFLSLQGKLLRCHSSPESGTSLVVIGKQS